MKVHAAWGALAACFLSLPEARTRLLVVTGGHPYDTVAFDAMWQSIPDVEFTVKPLAYGHEVFEDVSEWPYDALVFYNHQDPGTRLTARHQANFQALLDKGVGMLVLHHAVASYPRFPAFEEMAGVKYRSSRYYKDTLSEATIGVSIPCSLSEATHPLASGLAPAFTVTDEVYIKMAFGPDNRVLYSTSPSIAQGPLAWTRKQGNSRVFTTWLGHGSSIFSNAAFRAMMARGVDWIRPCLAGDTRPVCAAAPPPPRRALIFHKQNGFIHTATDSVAALLKASLARKGLEAETSEDSLAFTPQNLLRFGVVVFLNTNYRNGALLDRAQEEAFEGFIHGGGGFAGIHSAVPLDGSFEETVWPWYARLFGARFRSHPPARTAAFVIEDPDHPSTRGLPRRFELKDEWYVVEPNPRLVPGLKVLATVDETGFPAGAGMGDHPMSWHRSLEGGRTFVTLAGHDMAAFANPNFLAHVLEGVQWAGGWDSSTVVGVGPGGAAGGRSASRPRTFNRQGGTWLYRGARGESLEVRAVTGRFIEARRVPGPRQED